MPIRKQTQYAKLSSVVKSFIVATNILWAGAALKQANKTNKTAQERINQQNGVNLDQWTPAPGAFAQHWMRTTSQYDSLPHRLEHIQNSKIWSDSMAMFPVHLFKTWPQFKSRCATTEFDIVNHFIKLCEKAKEDIGDDLIWRHEDNSKNIANLMSLNDSQPKTGQYCRSRINKHLRDTGLLDRVLFAVFIVADGLFVYTPDKMVQLTSDFEDCVNDTVGPEDPATVILLYAEQDIRTKMLELRNKRTHLVQTETNYLDIKKQDKLLLNDLKLYWVKRLDDKLLTSLSSKSCASGKQKMSQQSETLAGSSGTNAVNMSETGSLEPLNLKDQEELWQDNLATLFADEFYRRSVGTLPIIPLIKLLRYRNSPSSKVDAAWNLVCSLAEGAGEEFTSTIKCIKGTLKHSTDVEDYFLNKLLGSNRRKIGDITLFKKLEYFRLSPSLLFAVLYGKELILLDHKGFVRYGNNGGHAESNTGLDFDNVDINDYLIVRTSTDARGTVLRMGKIALMGKDHSDVEYAKLFKSLKADDYAVGQRPVYLANKQRKKRENRPKEKLSTTPGSGRESQEKIGEEWEIEDEDEIDSESPAKRNKLNSPELEAQECSDGGRKSIDNNDDNEVALHDHNMIPPFQVSGNIQEWGMAANVNSQGAAQFSTQVTPSMQMEVSNFLGNNPAQPSPVATMDLIPSVAHSALIPVRAIYHSHNDTTTAYLTPGNALRLPQEISGQLYGNADLDDRADLPDLADLADLADSFSSGDAITFTSPESWAEQSTSTQNESVPAPQTQVHDVDGMENDCGMQGSAESNESTNVFIENFMEDLDGLEEFKQDLNFDEFVKSL